MIDYVVICPKSAFGTLVNCLEFIMYMGCDVNMAFTSHLLRSYCKLDGISYTCAMSIVICCKITCGPQTVKKIVAVLFVNSFISMSKVNMILL